MIHKTLILWCFIIVCMTYPSFEQEKLLYPQKDDLNCSPAIPAIHLKTDNFTDLNTPMIPGCLCCEGLDACYCSLFSCDCCPPNYYCVIPGSSNQPNPPGLCCPDGT